MPRAGQSTPRREPDGNQCGAVIRKYSAKQEYVTFPDWPYGDSSETIRVGRWRSDSSRQPPDSISSWAQDALVLRPDGSVAWQSFTPVSTAWQPRSGPLRPPLPDRQSQNPRSGL